METANRQEAVVAKKVPKPNNVITIPTPFDTAFFRWWCVCLRPVISLTERETDIVASFLKHRWELSQHIDNQAILDTMVMDDSTKKKVMKECHINLPHLYVVLSKLREQKVIINNTLNPKLIPNLSEYQPGEFRLMYLFKNTGEVKKEQAV